MGLFGFGKKDKVIDLTGKYKTRSVATDKEKEALNSSQETNPFSLFEGDAANGSSDKVDLSYTTEERKRRLAKRIMDMTEKIEELNNQIYHLQQRLEVLERKLDVKRFDSN